MTMLLFGLFAVMMLMGVPLATAMGLSGAAAIAAAKLGLLSVPISVYTGVAKYPLLAIPMFVFAGMVFERSGVALRLVNFTVALVGPLRGGLAVAAILVCMVLGGISGSGPADAAAVAMVMIPGMAAAGYPKAFSSSLIAAAGSTAILIPPSIAFILYSVLVPQASVPALFAAGLIPGFLAGLALVIPAWALSVRHGFGLVEDGASCGSILIAFKEAVWGLLAPVIILGGIRSGYFTPTEAAVAAVFYGLFVGFFVYRTLTLRSMYELLVESAEVSAVVMLIIALSSVFAWAGSTLGAFEAMGHALIGVSTNETVTLLAVIVVLFIAGMFLDGVSILFIFIPILLPVMAHFGWNAVWFGVLMTMSLAIGQFTPPLALNLMVTTRIAGIGMEETVPWVLWFVLAMTLAMLLVMFVPQLTLLVPGYLGYL
ncbi:TRAP transporter large permease [Desulfomicrobium escambiense]|uniref:TRAP transporter large permease n=1 Tax=Desulfomicrobium escambiense TaxID=29503 RepID=UPI0003FCE2C2|nr:TRAP transporter large permease [Desulfomicrobium escambiense]